MYYKIISAFNVPLSVANKIVHPLHLKSYCRQLGIKPSFELSSGLSVLYVNDLPKSMSIVDSVGGIKNDVPSRIMSMINMNSTAHLKAAYSPKFESIEPSIFNSIPPLTTSVVEYEKNISKKIPYESPSIEEMLEKPELDSIKPTKLDPASMMADDIETLGKEGKSFLNNPTIAGAATMAAIAIPGKFVDDAAEKLIKNSFVGKYKGKDVSLDNVQLDNITYLKRDRAEYEQLRKAFDSSIRKNYLKELSKDPNVITQLKQLGVKDNQIAKLADGKVPKGYQVHHKLPLDDGGTNDFDNLVLIRNSPEHSVFTTYQKQKTTNLQVGNSTTLEWPSPEGNVYPHK